MLELTLKRCSVEYAQAFSPIPLQPPAPQPDTATFPWTMFLIQSKQ